jgi:hypothetical protein
MKKIVLSIISILLVTVTTVSAQDNPERFNISYGMHNTMGDKRQLSGGDSTNSIVKVGSGVSHALGAEIFVGNRIYRPGFYGSYVNSSFLTDQFQAQKSWYYTFGYINQISYGPFQMNLYFGFFQKNLKISGYNSENKKFSDSSKIKGLDLGGNIIISQQDINIFPKIEIFGNGKFQFSRNMSGGIVPKYYSFGINIDIYRVSFADYYLSPTIGVEKLEELSSYRNMIYKLGISLDNNIVRSDIASLGVFVSWNNNIYNYYSENLNYSVKNAVFGIFLQVTPTGLFSQYVR